MDAGEKRRITCCFTGHRPEKMPYRPLKYSYAHSLLLRALEQEVHLAILAGYRFFITGMSRGLDLWAARQVILFRRAYPDVVLEAAIPCVTQSDGWNTGEREAYYEILRQCDTQTMVSEEYKPGCMQKRNRYMVDASSLVIAAYTGSAGGTRNTLTYAAASGVQIINLLPLGREAGISRENGAAAAYVGKSPEK